MSSGFISRSIAETHYQLGVAQAHCEDFVNAEKSLKAAISVLDKRVVNLKKMEVSENIKKELAELDTLCYDIKERMNDHKDMQKGVYKQDKDFVSVFKSKFLLRAGSCAQAPNAAPPQSLRYHHPSMWCIVEKVPSMAALGKFPEM